MKHLNITFITFAMISPLNDLNYRFSYIPHTHIIPHITLIRFVFCFVFVFVLFCFLPAGVHGTCTETCSARFLNWRGVPVTGCHSVTPTIFDRDHMYIPKI